MADILNLISTSSQNNEERYKFIQDLLVNKSDVPFGIEGVNLIQNTLLSLINNQLNHSSTRHEGLKLLLKALPRCSKDTLIKHSVLWITKALQILDTAQSDAMQVTTACEVIAKLAKSSKEVPELQKQISMQNVKQIITHVNNLNEEKRFGAVFYLIAVILYHYPEPCERLQMTIKKLILPLIDSREENLVCAGAKCFALLTAVTERSFQTPANRQHLTAWTYSQVLICNNIHETMDSLFAGITEIEHVEIWDKLALPSISQTDIMLYYLGLERRFNNLCVYLGTLLRGCGIRNSVSPINIFKVLSRGLFVTPSGLGNENAFRKQILHLILPNLHSSLLHVLDALVSGFGKELVPYAQTILQLIQQVLTWTETITENSGTLDGSRPFKNTRIRAYKSLSTWLMHAGVVSGLDSMCEEFLAHIIKDIVPEKDRVVLSVQKTHNMSKRALKRHREKQYDNNLAQNYVQTVSNSLSNADLAEEALITLQNIFLNTGCRLKLSIHEVSQSVLVALLYDCYLETNDRTFYKQISTCRLHLLKTIKMLYLNPHPSLPPPTQYCLEIYQMAQNDSDLNASQEAKIGLAEIEKTVHPAAPTLRLPIFVETPDLENEETEVEMTMGPNVQSKDVDDSENDAEEATENMSTPNGKNEDEEKEATEGGDCAEDLGISSTSQQEAVVDTIIDEPKLISEPDDSEHSRTRISDVIEITLDSDLGPLDNQNEAVEDADGSAKNRDISHTEASSRVDGNGGSIIVTDADEPVSKKQNVEVTEITEISVTDDSQRPEHDDKDSDDDIVMLESFCDTPQEDLQ